MGRRRKGEPRRGSSSFIREQASIETCFMFTEQRGNHIHFELLGEPDLLTPSGKIDVARWFNARLGGSLDEWITWIVRGDDRHLPKRFRVRR